MICNGITAIQYERSLRSVFGEKLAESIAILRSVLPSVYPEIGAYNMICTCCGTGLPDNAAICPTCGTINSPAWPGGQQPTNYGQYQRGGYDGPPQQQASYGQGYGQQPGYIPPQQPGYMPPQSSYNYGPPPNAAPQYQYQPGSVNVFVNNPPVSSNNALIVEVLLSVFLGIYGVGWLMAGETTVGIILLICSFAIYIPTLVLGTIFTLGLGLFCLVPLAIGAVVVNAILLNNALKRRAAQGMLFQVNQMPPQYPRYRQ
jgi:hypothetical protein